MQQDIESAKFMFAGAAESTITLSIAPRRASHQHPHYMQPSYQGGVYQQQGEIMVVVVVTLKGGGVHY